MRSRIVNAIESRISARLPPTWCWIAIAVAISSKSSDFTRRTMFSSATSNGRPRFTSRMTRPNSVEIGGGGAPPAHPLARGGDETAGRAVGRGGERGGLGDQVGDAALRPTSRIGLGARGVPLEPLEGHPAGAGQRDAQRDQDDGACGEGGDDDRWHQRDPST